jgi:hypothetical protein
LNMVFIFDLLVGLHSHQCGISLLCIFQTQLIFLPLRLRLCPLEIRDLSMLWHFNVYRNSVL